MSEILTKEIDKIMVKQQLYGEIKAGIMAKQWDFKMDGIMAKKWATCQRKNSTK